MYNDGHHHAHIKTKNMLFYAVLVTIVFAIIEALSGLTAGSLTLLSDAGHMVTDSLALILSAFAAWLATKPPSKRHTYGFGRAEVIAAWFSSFFMLLVLAGIIMEAIERFQHPEHVNSTVVMLVATLGLIVNLIVAKILSHSEKTLNVRAAILHVFGDVLASIATLLSGIIIYFSKWTLIDPILSIFIAILILISTLRLLREAFLVLMEGAPKNINPGQVGNVILQTPKVKSIHDLHIWNLTSGMILLSAHVEIDDLSNWHTVIEELRQMLKEKFQINHSTLQPETKQQADNCKSCNKRRGNYNERNN